MAASEVADPVLTRPDGEIDRWSCLGAALLEPYVVGSLPGVAQPSDRATLERLGQLLADPAAALCRAAARDMFDAASLKVHKLGTSRCHVSRHRDTPAGLLVVTLLAQARAVAAQ